MARLFLGVDGGQSSTAALVGDETGRVMGAGAAGPCNHSAGAEGRAKLLGALEEAVAGACREAGVDFRDVRFEAACLGFSGGPDDKEALVAEVVRAARLIVTTDAMVALAGATGGEPGVVVIAGTGSIGFGRNAAGKTARAGGWGYVFGDEGGGFDLARQALRAALRQEEGWGPATKLHAALLEAGGAKSANGLLHRFYTDEFSRAQIAAFGRLVERAAEEGDAVAGGILRKAAAELALLASAVRRQLFAAGERAVVSHLGGAFRSAILRGQFRELVEQEPGNVCGPPLYPPAAGALIEAYRACGLDPGLTGLPDVKR
jgi:N-acetylglucosamine kinase-like BadF-type ATPase